MRYYSIRVTDQNGKLLIPPSLRAAGMASPLDAGATFSTLLANGQQNPAALNIELDIPQYTNHAVDTAAYLKIWGVGLQDIGSAFDLNGANIEIRAGMWKGLPLANPKQAGLLVKGQIQQAFGNWIGNEMTLDMFLRPATGSQDAPRNYCFAWRAGTELKTALAQTFTTALPGFKQVINCKSGLVLYHDEIGIYGTLSAFAEAINAMTMQFYRNSDGIQIYCDGQTVTAWDGTVSATPKQIEFQDFLGQATWAAPGVVTLKLVMRGDLNLNDIILLPPGLRQITAAAQSWAAPIRNSSTFQGAVQIIQLQHWGNFRAPDAMSWNTTVWAVAAPKAS